MSIDELNEFMRDHGFCNTNNEEDLPKKYVCDLVESAMKDGYAKAINEFAERLKSELLIGLSSRIPAISLKDIDEIAAEMRGAE